MHKAILSLLTFLPPVVAQSDAPPTIDLYGVRKADRTAILTELRRDGTADRDELRQRALAFPEIEDARLTEMRLPGQRVFIVVVRESGQAELETHAAPTGAVRLPESMVEDYDRLMRLLREAIDKRVAGEDRELGYALFKYPPARELQLSYVPTANHHLALLREVLADSDDADHRAAAACWIAYADGDRNAVARALAHAVLDADSTVRNNATRALSILISYAAAHPELGLAVDPDPFVAMLGSTEWTDLNKASFALYSMSANLDRDGELAETLRADALPGLLDIARWSSEGHAYPAAAVLGRLAGMEDEAIGERYRAHSGDPDARNAWLEELAAQAGGPPR